MSLSPFDLKVYRIRQSRFSLFISTLVVWGWGFLILNALQGIGMALTLLLPVVLALPLLVISILFARRTHGLSGSFLFQSKRALWLLVVALTLLGYVLARMISLTLHHPEFVVPAATIIIGLHFLCFVPLFRSKGYYLTTAVFCLTAVVSVLVVPLTFAIGSLLVVNGWQLVNGCVCVLWLWIVAIRHVITGTARWHQIQTLQEQAAVSV